ncbi:helix-turn-helix transcriptional regulator [Pseudohoeflea coraliihabitans]|uniref:Autoinducer binding domain-containing protein n=1 Tax=Pseudohoeflea coraliihabitans TaxID=2860393 RepID=A0ABS6WL42_9HYPH|nr:autoinducer binding domain-containing protein [Pseudohoeflea sp. DP4N28-3]MBW3096595.1 autoinducer binding domain-containing protein [Pseudohoeflea sp. DP4N28-3]
MNKAGLLRFLELDFSDLSSADIIVALEGVIDEVGFDYFTLTRQPLMHSGSQDLVLCGRWPAGWPEAYVQRKYAAIDPMIRYLGYCQRGFSWSEAADAFRDDCHGKRIARMFKHAKKFGLEAGYVFPVHGRQGLAGMLSVGGQPVTLSASEVQLFEAVAKRAFWAIAEGAGIATPVAELSDSGVAMTKRELETLHLLAEGLTSGQMGSTLGLSAHTVDWYMNGIQAKLAAKNRHHAVALAFRRGLIS